MHTDKKLESSKFATVDIRASQSDNITYPTIQFYFLWRLQLISMLLLILADVSLENFWIHANSFEGLCCIYKNGSIIVDSVGRHKWRYL